jgi:hypothetical protein
MTTLTFKVTDDEARAIRALAKRERLSVSEFLRRRAKSAAAPAPEVTTTRCALTGVTIFAAAPHLPPLTTESVQELMASFP